LKNLGEDIAKNGIKDSVTYRGFKFSHNENYNVDKIADILIENHEEIPLRKVKPIEWLNMAKANTFNFPFNSQVPQKEDSFDIGQKSTTFPTK